MARNDSVTSNGLELHKTGSKIVDAMELDSPDTSFSSAMDIVSDSGTHLESSQTDTGNVTDISGSDLLYSTGRDLEAFHLFSSLKPELRKRIWLLAAPAPRTRFLEMYRYIDFTLTPQLRYIPPLPPLFHTSRESRKLSITHEGGELVCFTDDPPEQFYLNVERDIIFLSSRFNPDINTTETYRLRELTSFLPLPIISRLRRIVVTYSGLDSYEHIGPIFRTFTNLDAFYLAMMDWWSGKTMKRRLRKGRPKPDTMAEKVRNEVERTEAEETDDDEESEGERMERARKREGRRIVECEVRLDE
ncbi:hypothetical protein EK21DRAFT_117234 [Setomelanomma holmii]|uniref:2EXR domain-containing protein n=1 Tax=Setomelanomma holmii TaxID=210430 RepID=A0A9P4H0G6_9PLEO|nr:hypothetical protein EK21DRAFT_117234 [Setomelanomma holmii]